MTTQTYSKTDNTFSFYKKIIKQNISFPIITVVMFLIIVTLPEAYDALNYDPTNLLNFAIYVDDSHMVFLAVVLTMLMSIVAFVLNGYMHSKQKVDLFHGLPITRSQLFTANALAGITLVGAPFAIASIISSLYYRSFIFMQIITRPITEEIFAIVLILLHLMCVYLFISFISINVSTIVETVLITGVLGFMPLTVWGIFTGFMEQYMFGYSYDGEYVLLLSPFTAMFGYYEMGIYIIPVLVLLIAAFYLLGIYFYKRRKSEMAESRNNYTWPQIVSKVFVAFVSGAIFHIVFGVEDNILFFIPMIIFAFLISLVAEIILSRGVKSLRKSFKWLCLGIGLFIVMIVGINIDVMGYETFVPEPNRVASVNVSSPSLRRLDSYDKGLPIGYYGYNSKVLTDPEAIEIITGSHKIVVNDYRARNRWSGNTKYSDSMSVEYKLKNGKTVKRQYYNAVAEALENLVSLEANDNYIEQKSRLFDDELINSAVYPMGYYNATVTEHVGIKSEHREEILAALRSDMLNESLESMKNPDGFYGYLNVTYRSVKKYGENNYGNYNDYFFDSSLNSAEDKNVSIPLNEEYKNTLGLLSQYNYINANNQQTTDVKEIRILTSDKYNKIGIYALPSFEREAELDAYNYHNFASTTNPEKINSILDIASVQVYTSKEMAENDDVKKIMIRYYNGSAVFAFIKQSELPTDFINNIQENQQQERK